MHNLLHCGIGSPKLFKPVRWDEPGSVVEEKLSGDQGEGERDDQGCEEEGLKETGDHRRPEKRRREGRLGTPDDKDGPMLLCIARSRIGSE